MWKVVAATHGKLRWQEVKVQGGIELADDPRVPRRLAAVNVRVLLEYVRTYVYCFLQDLHQVKG